jgi:hypothetical protein
VNRVFNFLLAMMLVGSLTLAAPHAKLRAQSMPEPAVVISLADFSQQMGDIDYLVDASGFAQMKFMAQTMIKQYTKGIKTNAPSGVMMYFTEGKPEPDFLGFVPVENLEDLLDTISGMAEVDEGDDYITIVTDDGTEVLVKEVDGNAFFSNRSEMFENLPSDPASDLGDLPSKYNFSAKVFGQRIPAEMREQALQMIRDGYESQLEQMEETEPTQAKLQRENFEFQMKNFSSWINETDNLVLGMNADKDSKTLFMDIAVTAAPNSELASRLAAAKSKDKSMFSGFLMDGAAFTQNGCMGIHPDEAQEYSKMLDQLQEAFVEGISEEGDLSEEEIEVGEKALNKLVQIGKETLAEGILDSGAVVMLKDKDINVAAGVRLADPKKLEDAVKEVVAYAEGKMGDELQVDLNSGSHKGVTLHQVICQIPDDEEEMRDFLGDQVTFIVGIGESSAYLAAGTNPLPVLKQAMEEGTQSDKVMQYNLYIAPILKFVAGIEGEPLVENMATQLQENGGDRISMTSDTIENGIQMRFEMQDGILSLIKVGFESMGQGGFPGNPNDF